MKKLTFETEADFLEALDGKVYAISNGDGEFICDILEDDYIKLCDCGDMLEEDELFEMWGDCNKKHAYSDYVLRETLDEINIEIFKDTFGVEIEIKHES